MIEARKTAAEAWFRELRDRICAEFEKIEDELDTGPHAHLPPGRFERKDWSRTDHSGAPGGGGTISLMKGRVFEKVGVNISTVFGSFAPEFAKHMPGAADDPRFWASGISLVAHMRSPRVPATHMNTRHIVTTKARFGGGGDLTPMVPHEPDTAHFHDAYKAACDKHDPAYYPQFKKWCDEYFFLPHRNEPRGVGGIFFDNLGDKHGTGDWEKDFAFTRDVGLAFIDAYAPLVRAHMREKWTEAEREHPPEERVIGRQRAAGAVRTQPGRAEFVMADDGQPLESRAVFRADRVVHGQRSAVSRLIGRAP